MRSQLNFGNDQNQQPARQGAQTQDRRNLVRAVTAAGGKVRIGRKSYGTGSHDLINDKESNSGNGQRQAAQSLFHLFLLQAYAREKSQPYSQGEMPEKIETDLLAEIAQ